MDQPERLAPDEGKPSRLLPDGTTRAAINPCQERIRQDRERSCLMNHCGARPRSIYWQQYIEAYPLRQAQFLSSMLSSAGAPMLSIKESWVSTGHPEASIIMWKSWVLSMMRVRAYQLPSKSWKIRRNEPFPIA